MKQKQNQGNKDARNAVVAYCK